MTCGNDICKGSFDELQKEAGENGDGELEAEHRPESVADRGRKASCWQQKKSSRRKLKLRAQAVHVWNAETASACEKKVYLRRNVV